MDEVLLGTVQKPFTVKEFPANAKKQSFNHCLKESLKVVLDFVHPQYEHLTSWVYGLHLTVWEHILVLNS